MHSSAVPAAEAGWSGAQAWPAGAMADFALVADRRDSARPLPPRFALVASRAVPKGLVPPQYALAVEREPDLPGLQRRRWPYRAMAAALACHLALLLAFMLRPGGPGHLGMENGVPEQLEVSVISAAELDRRSSDPFRREALPAPEPENAALPAPPPEPPPAPPPQPQPPQQEAAATFSPSQSAAVKTQEFDPSGFIEMASAQFSSQLDHAFKAADARRERASEPRHQTAKAEARAGSVSVMRPGATHKGKSDPFAREVVWALAATKPMGNGKYGTVIVTFVVSDQGRLEGLRMLKSAGDKWLDTAVMLSVKQARMPKPPEPLPEGDRTFVVQYISQEGR